MLHVALAGGGEDRSRAKEQKALEQRMIEYVQQCGGERQSGGPAHSISLERKTQTEPDENDADILHSVIGEQSLQVVLHQGVEHAEHAGEPGEREHNHAPPPCRLAEEIEDDPHEAVDGDFRHHPAHQRGNMAGRGRMGERQPDMQRHKPCLGARAEQRKTQRQSGDRGGWMRGPDISEGIAAVRTREQTEGEQQRERAEARHDDIHVSRPYIVRHPMMRQHQRP